MSLPLALKAEFELEANRGGESLSAFLSRRLRTRRDLLMFEVDHTALEFAAFRLAKLNITLELVAEVLVTLQRMQTTRIPELELLKKSDFYLQRVIGEINGLLDEAVVAKVAK